MSSLAHQITYCGNVHPVKVFSDLENILKNITPTIQSEFGKSFPLGLWLPNSAMQEALSDEGVKLLRDQFDRLETLPITFNAFPMEVFHGERVKENVYVPDWSQESRLQYTQSVAKLGAKVGMKDFCISTLSGGFRPNDTDEKISSYIDHWLDWVEWARKFESDHSVKVALALEPEPFNTMEDESDAISLWQKLLEMSSSRGLNESDCQRYFGLCFDTCHFSVRYISLIDAWKRLAQVGMPVHKIQVSVAPSWSKDLGEDALQKFFSWEEPVYLHQTFAKVSGKRFDFLDLDEAKRFDQKAEQWRTHFHVPIHYGHREDSTGGELMEFLSFLKTQPQPWPVLEVETYSFNSMGEQWGKQEVLETSIAKEMLWLQEQMS